MKNYRAILNNLLQDESGQDLIEYGLVASVIALAAVASIPTIGTTIGSMFSTLSSKLTTATTGS